MNTYGSDCKRKEQVYLKAHGGYFEADGTFCIEKTKDYTNKHTHILYGKQLSCAVDAFCIGTGERIFAKIGGKLCDLVWLSDKVKYGIGYAVYAGHVEGYYYEIKVFVPKELPVKLISVTTNAPFEISYYIKPEISCAHSSDAKYSFSYCSGGIDFRNTKKDSSIGFAFGLCKDEKGEFCEAGCLCFDENEPLGCAKVFSKEQGENNTFGRNAVFVLGWAKDENGICEIMKSIRRDVDVLFKDALLFCQSFTSKIAYNSKSTNPLSKTLGLCFNKWLCFDMGKYTYLAHGDFFQKSQMQYAQKLFDCTGLLVSHKEICKKYIKECCARQLEDASVVCSSREHSSEQILREKNFALLPYVVAKYVLFSGDAAILDEKVPFFDAPFSLASVYHHCLKGVAKAVQQARESPCDMPFVCDMLSEFSKVCGKYDDLRTSCKCLDDKQKLENAAIKKEDGKDKNFFSDKSFFDKNDAFALKEKLLREGCDFFGKIGDCENSFVQSSILWTVLLENVFCIRIYDAFGEKMTLEFSDNVFCVPFIFDREFEININVPQSGREICIKYKASTKNEVLLDGKEAARNIKIKKGTKCTVEIRGKKE